MHIKITYFSFFRKSIINRKQKLKGKEKAKKRKIEISN